MGLAINLCILCLKIVRSTFITVITSIFLFCCSDETTRADLKKLPTLPTKVLKEHPSLAYWYAHWKCLFETSNTYPIQNGMI